MTPPIRLDRYRHIVVLTGAGISVGSGLQPYRGPGGLWEGNPEAERAATASSLGQDPEGMWRFFGPLRQQALRAQPNPAHLALARLEERCGNEGRDFLLITQNVDGLHAQAGNRQLAELHGSLLRSRCSRCPLEPFADALEYERIPVCPLCGSMVRPDIVLFGEEIPVEAGMAAKRSLRECDLFLAVGTSGQVAPASHFVRSARYVGARTLLVNLQPSDPPQPDFQKELIGRAEDLLPQLFPDQPQCP